MPEIDDVLESEDFQSKAAAVGAGILVIIAGFLVYNYFSKIGEEGDIYNQPGVEEQLEEEIENEQEGAEIITEEEEEEEEEEGQIEGTEGETVTELEELGEEVATEEDTAKATWQPTDYKPGDIEEDEYTVKNGDTLWEIAEARYGSGFEWTKIRDANSEQIGYLPDGSQALIEVGQTLVLP